MSKDQKLSLHLTADLLRRAEKLAKRLEADEEPVGVAVVNRRVSAAGLDQLERATRRRR